MPKQIVYGITRQELIKHTNVCLTPGYLVVNHVPAIYTQGKLPVELWCQRWDLSN